MQLEKNNSIKSALALATSTLLATTTQWVYAENGSELEMDSSVLFYSEIDRVTAIEPVIRIRKQLDETNALSARLVLDSLTGPSANGAIPQNTTQTFTSPSGNSIYTVAPNATPLDPSFRDTRVSLSVDWEKLIHSRLTGILSAHASDEFDYASLGVAGQLSRDLNARNTTVSLGLSYNIDLINPVGDIPVGLSSMPSGPSVNKTSVESEATKQVLEVLMGLTQVINRKTLVQLNYSFGHDSGYLTDPYKILSVTDIANNLRATDPYLYEQRPDSRNRHTVYSRLIRQFKKHVLDLSYRYYWDDWDISSHTLDFRYRLELNKTSYLQPHIRYYNQTAASFYFYNLTDGAIPQFASADYRLGNLVSSTIGLKFGFSNKENREFSLRLEYMSQNVDSVQPVPGIKAAIVQFSFSIFY